ncbi:expressed unknown protein [Seminavis robusta]|uniref:Uncharacterized protein n=1 Tax=Seminavis robusta TaxID=568900 RepID=A0A9N8HG58_9STRA|nr:expressed unknown protein [Seminavis robusta]|eukprot:Sro382_g131170.1 n/a (633) ;mRNA; r:61600-63602
MLPVPRILPLVLTAIASAATATPNNNDDAVFRWSSTGGGWRAMFACIGFSNVFRQAGLFSEDAPSLFSGIATTSGASWFNTQLFYSPSFYQQTVLAENPQQLHDFTIRWMQAYHALTQDIMPITNHVEEVVNMTSLRPNDTSTNTDTRPKDDILTFLWDFYDLVQFFGGIGATLFSNCWRLEQIRLNPMSTAARMILVDCRYPKSGPTPPAQAQEDEGNDYFGLRKFLERIFETHQDMAVYLGPQEQDQLRYSVPLSAGYVVNETFAGFLYNTFDSPSSTELQTHVAALSPDFHFDQWVDFHLFGSNDNATVLIPSFPTGDTTTDILDPPFGGNPEGATLIQLSAVSSAFGGPTSPEVPSSFAQLLSRPRAEILESKGFLAQRAFDEAVRKLYESESLDEMSICSQWPTRPCGAKDGRFIDGGLADNPAVVINVGQYHQQQDANLTKTLKLVLTNTNDHLKLSLNSILQYFSTTFNQEVAPGEHVWPPGFFGPIRSTQFMEHFLDEATLLKMLDPIGDNPSSNTSTAVLRGTTIDNPAFGIRAGQVIEILLINLNADITTYIAGPNLIQATTVPMAEMTRDLAASQELVRRVQNFFGLVSSSNDGTSSATTPVPSVNEGASIGVNRKSFQGK